LRDTALAAFSIVVVPQKQSGCLAKLGMRLQHLAG